MQSFAICVLLPYSQCVMVQQWNVILCIFWGFALEYSLQVWLAHRRFYCVGLSSRSAFSSIDCNNQNSASYWLRCQKKTTSIGTAHKMKACISFRRAVERELRLNDNVGAIFLTGDIVCTRSSCCLLRSLHAQCVWFVTNPKRCEEIFEVFTCLPYAEAPPPPFAASNLLTHDNFPHYSPPILGFGLLPPGVVIRKECKWPM